MSSGINAAGRKGDTVVVGSEGSGPVHWGVGWGGGVIEAGMDSGAKTEAEDCRVGVK